MPNPTQFWQSGLPQVAVRQQRQTYGQNTIPHRPPPSDFYFFISQFKNPLVMVLLAALIITLFLHEWTDGAVIGLAILVNTTLGFIQERKAYKTLESLKQVLTPHAWVVRDKQEQQISVEEVVVGDAVLLKQGDKIPADGVIVQTMDCWLNEAVVTGESQPVQKTAYNFPHSTQSLMAAAEQLREADSLAEKMQAFMGTVVATGAATMIVTQVGAETTLGKIAQEVQEQSRTDTPLAKRLAVLARWLTLLVIILATGVFILGLVNGQDWTEMFTITVALAVAAIPEGLVVSLTAVLALGMYRILQRQAVVKHLMAAETLGSVSTICLDKTGTLTAGKLKVVQTDFTDLAPAQLAAVLANDHRDPLDIARLDWARRLAKTEAKLLSPDEIRSQHQNLQLLSFSAERLFVAAQTKFELFAVGAPEAILTLTDLSKTKRQRYQQTIDDWTKQGQRVIAFAHRRYAHHSQAKADFNQLKDNKPTQQKLKFLGLMSFSDPIRTGIAAALQKAIKAGLKPAVITGDYASTAKAIMKQLDLKVTEAEIMTGPELSSLTDMQLQGKLSNYKLFARIKPQQKLRIVELLQKNNQVVGMMGDGVNDAPALSAADIGIVVDDASEVAREAADLVLLKNNFNTVLSAIEEGRMIFNNLRKITLYLLSDTFSELLLVIGSLVLKLPLPITAAQILWINLVDDGLPNLALTLDPPTGDELEQPPIKHDQPIIDREIRLLIAVISLLTGGGLLLLFMWLAPRIGVTPARSIVFTTLSIDSLLYVFSSRSLSTSIIHDPPWRNPWLIAASGVGLLLTVAAVQLPLLQNLLELTALNGEEWLLVGSMSLSLLVVVELMKLMWLSAHVQKQSD